MAVASLFCCLIQSDPSLTLVLMEITSFACNFAGRADLIPSKRDSAAQPAQLPITAGLGPSVCPWLSRVFLSQVSCCDLSKDDCEPKAPALWWGHGSLGARDSESGSWHGGTRFGELALLPV